MELIKGAGLFIYPLGLCSILAALIIVERLIALQPKRVLPQATLDAIEGGSVPEDMSKGSAIGRIGAFFFNQKADPEALKAYAELEVARLERGFFILEIVIAAAPLIGLLGTVMGLVQVFGNFSTQAGAPDPKDFSQGIALALTTTMLGLLIAIPAIIGSGYLNRRLDLLCAKINMEVEKLLSNNLSV